MIKAIDELAQLQQWVGWNYEGQPSPTTGKRRKVPRDPNTGRRAASTRPSTWASHQDAQDLAARQQLAGIGFVFTAGDTYCGVDLDRCRDKDSGEVTALGWRIIKLFNSYTEISPSGTGVKIFCRGTLPDSLDVDNIGPGIAGTTMGLEMYSQERYFAVTADHLAGTPDTINDAQAMLDELFEQYKKDNAPVLRPVTPSAPSGTPDLSYPLAWVKKIIDRAKDTAADKVATAIDGHKHRARLEAGTLLGGYIAGLQAIGFGFLLGEDEAAHLLYNANPPKTNQRGELDSIRDAIAYGLQSPVDIPKPERAPIISAHGHASATHSPATAQAYAIPPVSLETVPEMPAATIIKQCLFEDESGDARLLRALHGDRLAYDTSSDVWYAWSGNHWQQETIGFVRALIESHVGGAYLGLAVHLNAAAATETDLLKKQEMIQLIALLQQRAGKLHKLARLNNVATLAQHWVRVDGKVWDARPWLLGVLNGVIDLRTGDLLPSSPAMYIRKVAPTEYCGLATPAPRWEKFLSELFDPAGPNAQIPAYLGRLFGYGLIGEVRQHILAVFWGGQGRNGKGTMLRTIRNILGDYSGPVPKDLIIDTGKSGSPGAAGPHWLELQGKRLVWGSETDSGARFSLAAAKFLSGGDEITARPLFGRDYIKFNPSHQFILLTNERPKASSEDSAFWSRLQLVPFTMRFLESHELTGADDERLADVDLEHQLASEAAGILAWMVRGCLEYQAAGGVLPPEAVRLATQEYRENEDTFGDFIEECLCIAPGATATPSVLLKAYNEWAGARNLKETNDIVLGRQLTRRGFTKKRGKKGYIYIGIGVRAVYDDPSGVGSGAGSYTDDLPHCDAVNQQAVYDVYDESGNFPKSEKNQSHEGSYGNHHTHHTPGTENTPLESDKTDGVGSENHHTPVYDDPTPVNGHTPQQADPPPSLLDQAATLISEGQFDEYEALKARHPGYDWAGSTDQRASYKRWRQSQKR